MKEEENKYMEFVIVIPLLIFHNHTGILWKRRGKEHLYVREKKNKRDCAKIVCGPYVENSWKTPSPGPPQAKVISMAP